jgi:hypothetical protein
MITQLAAMALIIALGWYMGYKKPSVNKRQRNCPTF